MSAGDLTQLEWVDLCANELLVDGVEFSRAHFPRIDEDYVAQLKKLCADRCLTVASLHHETPFDVSDVDQHVEKLSASLDLAAGLGAPLVRLSAPRAGESSPIAWRELIRGLKHGCLHAKFRNITLALEPAAGSLVATPADAKRAMKECDSAWLRLAPSAVTLASGPSEEWNEALEFATIVVARMSRLDTFGADEGVDYIAALSALWQRRFLGFLTLEYRGAEDEGPAVARAVAWLRGILAKDTLKAAAIETAS